MNATDDNGVATVIEAGAGPAGPVDRCHNCGQPVGEHSPYCPASHIYRDRLYRRRRRRTKSRDRIRFPGPYNGEVIFVRKPLHKWRGCPLCQRRSNMPWRKVCRSNDACRCGACVDRAEWLIPPYKTRPEQFRAL